MVKPDKLADLRNYFSPIKTYFSLKKEYNEEKDVNKKEAIMRIIQKAEKVCYDSMDNINNLLKK
jgi:hypothetical protein